MDDVPSASQTPEELAARYGLSRRLAARVASLSRFGLAVDEAVLARGDSAPGLEALLTSPDLFNAVEEGDWDEVARLGASTAPGLLLVGDGEERTLTLAPAPPHSSESALPVRYGALRSQMAVVSDLLDEGLAPHLQEALRILLTSPEAARRLEALRRLLLELRDPAFKSAVLFYALRDPDRSVAVEAVKALGELGLSGDAADLLVEAINAPPDRAGRILAELVGKLEETEPLEATVLLAFVVRLYRDEPFAPHKKTLLTMFNSLLRRSPEAGRNLPGFLRMLLRHLPFDSREARSTGRRLLLDMVDLDRKTVLAHLWTGLETATDPVERSFLVDVLTHAPLTGKKAKELDALVLEGEIPSWLKRGEAITPHVRYLVSRWRSFAEPLLARAEEESEDRRAMLLRVAGEILGRADAGPRQVGRVIARCLDAADSAEIASRRAVMRSGLHRRADLTDKVRARFAALFLTLLEAEFFPEYNAEIYEAIRELGLPAVGPLLDYIAHEVNDISIRSELVSVVESLLADETVLKATPAGKVTAAIRRIERIGRQRNLSVANRVACLLGTVVVNPAVSRDIVRSLAKRSLKRIQGKRFTPGDVAVASSVAASPRVSQELKMAVARRLIAIMGTDSREVVAESFQDEEGLVLRAAKGSDIHTILIPAAVEGLRRVAASLEGDMRFAYMISRFLMRKYEETERLEIIWSLQNRKLLLLAVSDLGAAAGTPERLKQEIFLFLTRLYWKDPTEFTVVEILGSTLGRGRVPGTGEPAGRIARDLLTRALRSESMSPAEVEPYLVAAARILSGPNVEKPDEKDMGILAGHLEGRVEDGSERAREALSLMAGAAHVPGRIRKRVETFLASREEEDEG